MPKEWKKYASIRHLDNLEVLKAMFFRHSYSRHFHEGYAIGTILTGSETYLCSQKLNVAPKGSLVVVNPGEIHNGHASDIRKGWGYFMIYPHLSLVKKALGHLGMDENRLPVFPESVMFDPDAGTLMSQFMAAFEAGDSKLSLESQFLEILNLLIRRHAAFSEGSESESKDPDKVRQVKEIIHSEYAENLSLDSLAGHVGLSPYALLRRFKKQTGMSPYLLQAGLRIQKAKKALLKGRPLAETAAECGFSDQSHMTHQFKRWIGVTPGEYYRAGRD